MSAFIVFCVGSEDVDEALVCADLELLLKSLSMKATANY